MSKSTYYPLLPFDDVLTILNKFEQSICQVCVRAQESYVEHFSCLTTFPSGVYVEHNALFARTTSLAYYVEQGLRVSADAQV